MGKIKVKGSSGRKEDWRLGRCGNRWGRRKRKPCLWAPASLWASWILSLFFSEGRNSSLLLSALFPYSSFYQEREVEDCDFFPFLSSWIFTKKTLKDASRTRPDLPLCSWVTVSTLGSWWEIKFSSEPRSRACTDTLSISLLEYFWIPNRCQAQKA